MARVTFFYLLALICLKSNQIEAFVPVNSLVLGQPWRKVEPISLRQAAFPTEVATCFLPTCLGFIKSDYGVSYGYGTAVALTAWLVILQHTPAAAHAWALVFYGCRLNLFLLYRQNTSKRIQEMNQRIEERAKSRGSRWKRTPFIASCSLLYFGLCAPLYLSATPSLMSATMQNFGTRRLFQGLVATTWFGFILAAIGDLTKTWVKQAQGEDFLVTDGIFQFLRHPNYTGEMMGWTANFLAGLVVFLAGHGWSRPDCVAYLVASIVGVTGINLVLKNATRNLEKKQAETYGTTQKYRDWVKTSWVGFC